MNQPLVSVIISAFNAEAYISEAVQSILDQQYNNLEILIADDYSSDRTRSIIDSIADSRIKRFHNDSNLGYLLTWNKLLLETKGNYITFQDADDVSLPGRIEKLVKFLEANSKMVLCGTNFIRYFKPWGISQRSHYPLTDAEIRKAFENEIVPFNGTRVMIRKSMYEKVGGFREYFKELIAEDFDWILRIADQGQVANLPEVLYEYRYFSRSASKYSLQSPVERVYVSKIIFFLTRQRQQFGSDAIQNNQLDQIQEFLIPFREELAADSTNYIRYNRVFSNALANRDFAYAGSLWINRLKQYPIYNKNIVDLYRLISVFMRTLVKSVIYKFHGRR